MIYGMDHIWTADMKSSGAMILAVMNAIFEIAERNLKNSGLQRGLNPSPRDTGAGSNPVDVLNFSGFFTQLQKLRS